MEEIKGFSKAEYLMTLQSIIMGFIVSEYFEGIGHYLKRYKHYTRPLHFLLFAFLSLAILLIFWWNTWNRSEDITLSIGDYLQIFPYTLIFYLITILLFGDSNTRSGNLLFTYFKNSTKLYALLGFYFLYDLVVSVSGLTTFQYAGLVLSVVGIISGSQIVHLLILIVGVLCVFTYVGVDFFWGLVGRNDMELTGYSKVEHLTIFLSFLYGYVVARFFIGWARIVRKWGEIRFSLIHLLWTLLVFFLLIDIWWGSWDIQVHFTDHLLNFLVVMITPFFLYLISLFMFPTTREAVIDYRQYFRKQKQFVFPIFGLLLISSLFISVYFGNFDVEFSQNMLRISGAVLALIAWRAKRTLTLYILFFIALVLILTDLLFKSAVL